MSPKGVVPINENDFAAETVVHFNHEGYRDASMEDDCQLQESFDVDECNAFDGCNILNAAAAKAAFASERYRQASIALKEASLVYKKMVTRKLPNSLKKRRRLLKVGTLLLLP